MNDATRFVLAVVLVAGTASCGSSRPGSIETPAVDSGLPHSASCPHPAVRAECKDGWCYVPAGCFVMGSPESEPLRARYGEEQREITLTHALLVSDHETTQAEWTSFGFANESGKHPYPNGGGNDCIGPECPVGQVGWFDALAYANKLSDREGLPHCIEPKDCTGTIGVDFVCKDFEQTTPSIYECRGYRLPNIFEAEYFTRAGTTSAFSFGEFTLEMADNTRCVADAMAMDHAWYCANSKQQTHPVRQKAPNPFGVFDVHGNAGEWALDDDRSGASDAASDPRPALSHGRERVIRNGVSTADLMALRSAATTNVAQANTRGALLGFRLVRSLTPAEASAWRKGN